MSYSMVPRERLEGEVIIEAGCTHGWVELTRTASGVYILSMLAVSHSASYRLQCHALAHLTGHRLPVV
jgi:hypothetical protein